MCNLKTNLIIKLGWSLDEKYLQHQLGWGLHELGWGLKEINICVRDVVHMKNDNQPLQCIVADGQERKLLV